METTKKVVTNFASMQQFGDERNVSDIPTMLYFEDGETETVNGNIWDYIHENGYVYRPFKETSDSVEMKEVIK